MRRPYLVGACLVVGFLIALEAGAAASGATRRSGIAGRVVSGPTCPVETVPPQPGCAPRPLVARLRIHGLSSRRPAIVVRSGTDGRFRVELTPGEYVVRALQDQGSPLPRPPQPFDVQVKAGRFTRVTVTYDTGIR